MTNKLLPALVFSLLIPSITYAQPQNNMMAMLQEVAMCMDSIDKNQIKALENDSLKFSDTIEKLCKQGDRDEAQKKAVEYSKIMIDSPVLKEMNKCTAKLPESMKGMVPAMDPKEMVGDYSKHHVCDES